MRHRSILLPLLLAFLLAACAGNDEPPQPTIQPTGQPTNPPTSQPTAPPPAPPTTPPPTTPWWNDAVFYEIFVRSFYDADGDGVGDLNGLIERLDYLNDGDPTTTDDLGITGIWLMPIAESPSYHGYDVVDYYAVDQEYGTHEDFLRLIDEAHARGIRVVVDLVLNHTSVEHPWFEASRDPASEYRDWYIWSESDPGYRGPDNQVVWHLTPSGYYYGVFWSGMPDLNLTNPDVTEELDLITRYWLEEMRVDGFRLDAIKHFVELGRAQENTPDTHAWLGAYHDYVKSVRPDAFLVGEAWTSTEQVVDYTGDEVDIAFQFDLARGVLDSVGQGLSVAMAREQQLVVDSFPSNQYAIFLSNHDQNRVMSQLDGDEDQAKMAASWLLTSPGVPFIYYGEEIGQQGVKPDEDIRRPMQWEPSGYRAGFTTGIPWRAPAPDAAERNVALQREDPASLFNHYRQLIHLRNDHPALRVGGWIPVETNSIRTYAFLRHTPDETILVVLNLSANEDAKASLSLAEGPLPAAVSTTLLFGSGEPAPLTPNAAGGFDAYLPYDPIPPYSTTIIQLVP